MKIRIVILALLVLCGFTLSHAKPPEHFSVFFKYPIQARPSSGRTQNHELEISAVDLLIAQHELEDGEDHGHQFIELKLKPTQWSIYQELQWRIAEVIPDEEKRPTVFLTLSESTEPENMPGIGILGGMGPLADAELIQALMNRLKASQKPINWKQFVVHILSAPPPRSLQATTGRGLTYLHRIGVFASQGYQRYYLASNTAHIHITGFKTMVKGTWIRGAPLHSEFTVVDLVAHAVQSIGISEPPLLVLSSKATYDARLYDHYLTQKGWTEAKLVTESHSPQAHAQGQFYLISSPAQAQALQDAIDLAKAGQVEESQKHLKTILVSEIKQIQTPTGKLNILLGCTELPLALKGGAENDLILTLKNELGIEAVLIDTSRIFAEKIASDIVSLTEE